MGLERIEVENFKSYVGRHVIGPFDRFTCIVGPNGSGKSNIMDAVTFCLGLGARHLRASNAKALINSRCSHASVTLHIEDRGERRGFRRHVSNEGRSLYFIDSENVGYERFKEAIEEMNLLIDARNFLVFQGDVNAIGNMMPMELTRLFEEMSGSIKLKEVYEERQREQARAVSVCSSLFEERKEVMSRMREAEEVKEQEGIFRRLVDRKHEIQREIVLHELMEKRGRKRDISDEESQLELESRGVQSLIDSKEKEVEAYRSRISEIRREYFEADALMSKEKETIAERRAWKYEAEQERDKRRVRLVEVEMEIKSKEEMISGKKREIDRRRREMEGVDAGYFELCREEEERKKRLGEMDAKKEVIDMKEKELLQMCGEDREKVNTLDLEVFSCRMMRDDCKRRVEELRERDEDLQGKIREKKVVRGNTRVKIDALERSEAELCRKVLHHEERYKKLVSEEKQKNEELSWILGEILRIKGKRRIDDRRSMVISTVETLKGMFPGVYGRVVDLIEPTQDRYETGLSVLLGSHDQSVVVDTETTAMSCINFMKEKRLCKMTFLPIQSLRDGEERKGMDDVVGEYCGAVRRAVDTVRYDAKYKRVVLFLLKEKLIADSLEIAKDICYSKGMKVSVCTLDGIYIHGGGHLISGGGVGRNKFQSEELDELLKRRTRILDEVRRIQDCKNELSYVEVCRERIEVWRKSKAMEMEAMKDLDVCIEGLEQEVMENKKLLSEAEESLRHVEKEMEALEGKMKEHRQKIEEVEGSVFCGIFPNAWFRSFEEYKEARDCGAFGLRRMEYENVRAKIELRIEMLEQEKKELEEEIRGLREGIEKLREMDNNDGMDVDVDSSEVGVLSEKRRRKLEAFEKARDEFKEINEEFRRLVEKKNELDQRIVYCASSKERVEEEIKNVLSFAVLEEIEIPCAGRRPAGEMSIDEIDFSGLEGNAEELRRELEEINQKISSQAPLMRIEEKDGDRSRYAKISEEYERQKAAAISAKNEFNEIRKRRTHLFMECFEKVNKELSRIYKCLTMTETSEGNAYLALENTLEPFKEGIRFHLMPPNKRFREVRLLSGGEKTMAVLSLLFSFHAYRPAPFYLFDEVDSALDKTNVSRIISFIISSTAQFILITLKPSLFQHSDGLVGVYKDPHEDASKILTYRLND
ncbi:chromosome segregation ATPase [Encephalitozoon hellem ATCC 50504]|uniref:Structural maintenance of chromosomes protein n=1 Tax=Encephalitozoon hellem TaxID=27973 RepID=A0A9Q9C7S1_ENCHE|nr:chromosome segregation ATPase [Encephalitozoon hellem ATCC 50504]AFM98135.1 chromosome segregation ATPase [Encephalitozoon hellem ATCC 50504]UTX42980.1 structural maintenance of chromosomes protein [Encephalitozoon hellem]|eukprot:XP_003887116.1 chromosome segregation ATPase [Encephalitozoon hellem ATCC 50504]